MPPREEGAHTSSACPGPTSYIGRASTKRPNDERRVPQRFEGSALGPKG